MKFAAKIKFDDKLPWRLEQTLTTKYNFRHFARKRNEWVIFEKIQDLDPDDIPEHIQKQLTLRCNKIVDFFLDPDANQPVIRRRIKIMAGNLPNIQKKWVENWLKRTMGDD